MYEPKFPDLYNSNLKLFKDELELYKVPQPLINRILDLVKDTDYFEAPASIKYHGAIPGGLFTHSKAVASTLYEWHRDKIISFRAVWSPAIIGFLHDFCKVGRYKCTVDSVGTTKGPNTYHYEYRTPPVLFGAHGEDSLCKILLKVPLSEEEAMCIRWHMGAYEKDKWNEFDRAVKTYPNVLWTHHADMIASKIMGV